MSSETLTKVGDIMKLFTSESVSAGHPDKMADLISDSILDEILAQDPSGRVAVETLLSSSGITLAGEVTTKARVNFENTARQAIEAIDPEYEAQAIYADHIIGQSPNISAGVDTGGAGDQGMMFGYATNETDALMPMPITVANDIIRALDILRQQEPRLLADAKSQVSVNNRGEITDVVVSTRHTDDISLDEVRRVVSEMLDVILLKYRTNIVSDVNYLINPAGKFVIGGPLADTGLTGRKIIVDTYGGMARHGGGAFSGKDATKVDRSGAYMARYVAKNIVAAGLADKCEIQLAYAIGVAEPVSVRVDTFGTANLDERVIERAIREVFDLTPLGIIKALDLRKPIFAKTAVGGHFGRDEFAWEKTDKINDLLEAI